MTVFALYVELKAKPGREEDVATFLANARALVLAETGTVAWFAVRFDKATGKQKEYQLRIARLVKHGDVRANVKLEPGDVIIIPESMF